jgi:RNA polymerase sigma-70 factor (ECF subfamily)
MTEPTDEDLMRRFAEGDESAFRTLFDRYRDPLFRYALAAFEPDPDAAADAVQETFIRLIRARASYDPARRFASWLYAIARNTCINRARAARPAVSLDETEPADPRPDAPRLAETAETAERVRAAVRALPARYREVLALHELDGLPCTRVAEILGLSSAATRTLAHRARRALRERLEPFLEPDHD